jgi:hypothetical protein
VCSGRCGRSGFAQFVQEAKIIGSNGDGTAQGHTVSLSQDGNTALIAGPGAFVSFPDGGTWVFKRVRGQWKEQTRITTIGIDSVSLSSTGNTALIGSPFGNTDVSTGFVFERSFGQWRQQATLIPTLAGRSAVSVALAGDGNTAIVGSPEANAGVGAGFVFTRRFPALEHPGRALVGVVGGTADHRRVAVVGKRD